MTIRSFLAMILFLAVFTLIPACGGSGGGSDGNGPSEGEACEEICSAGDACARCSVGPNCVSRCPECQDNPDYCLQSCRAVNEVCSNARMPTDFDCETLCGSTNGGEAETEGEVPCQEICETWGRCVGEGGEKVTVEWCLDNCNTPQDCNLNCSSTNQACDNLGTPSNLDCDALCGN